MTAVDILRPAVRRYSLAYDAACIVAGSLLIAASAQMAIRLPLSPVPITGQTMTVLLIGALLGSRRGLMCVLLYLAEGTMGLPVFAGGGLGLVRLVGPTGGYLVGMAGAAFLTGWLAEAGWFRRPATSLLALLAGSVLIYACGLAWLVHFVGSGQVLAAGLLPFIPGDLLKLVAVAAVLPSACAFLNSQEARPR
jgi:biotin transport system substrate-specific component